MNNTSNPVVHQLKLGPMDNFIYVLGDSVAREAAVIDPAWDTQTILANTEMMGFRITKIFLTHHHHDHTNGIRDLVKSIHPPDTKIYMLAEEIEFYRFKCQDLTPVYDGEIIRLGSLEIKVIHTPGHTVGSVCYFIDGHLFTGDTLFIDECGRTDIPGGSDDSQAKSLKTIAANYPESTIIFPGHDYGPTKTATLGSQKRTNPYLKFD